MKSKLLALGLVFFMTKAMAISNAIVVKTKSFPCDNQAKAFLGSGTLFSHEGVTYALTSEHVVLQSNESICHQVLNSYLGTKNAELVAADWGVGLALLRLTDPVSLAIPSYKDLKPREVSEGAKIVSYGFPHASWFSMEKTFADVASLDSGRGLIPLAPHLIEAEGGWVEYGMSGGPVFTEGTDAFAGVLTHQGVTSLLWPEAPNLIFHFRNSSRFFVIPSAVATKWIRKILIDGKDFRPTSKRDVQLQMAGTADVVFSSGFRFESQLQTSMGPIGGPEGVGRAGDGPIGGPEGVGRIGGNGDAQSGLPSFAQVVISLDEVGHGTDWRLIYERFPYLQEQLQVLPSVTIPYFVKRESQEKTPVKVYFSSLAEFFTLLQDPSLDTVVLRPASFSPTMGTVACSNANFSVILQETSDLTKRTATVTKGGRKASLQCKGWTDDPDKSLQFSCGNREAGLEEDHYLLTVLIYKAQGSAMVAAIDPSGAVEPSEEISCRLEP